MNIETFSVWRIPFDTSTYLIENDLDTYTWKDLPIVCIESTEILDVQSKSVTANRIKNVPPEVRLELKGLTMPTINIPNLPTGATPDGVVQYINKILPTIVQPIIDQAVQDVVKDFIKVIPTAGYQNIDFAVKWASE